MQGAFLGNSFTWSCVGDRMCKSCMKFRLQRMLYAWSGFNNLAGSFLHLFVSYRWSVFCHFQFVLVFLIVIFVFCIPFWVLCIRLRGENRQLTDFTRKLEEFSCWVENIENALDEKATISHEENLQELMVNWVIMIHSFSVHVCASS